MPSAFLTPLKVQAPEGGETAWTLLEDFKFYLDPGNDHSETILLRAGLTTDFASIPRPLWWLYPPYDPVYGKAAVLHDGLYQARLYSRLKCDKLFLEGMAILGASRFTRNVMYEAVRLCGASIYKSHKPAEVRFYRSMVLRIPAELVPAQKAGAVSVGELIDLNRREEPPPAE